MLGFYPLTIRRGERTDEMNRKIPLILVFCVLMTLVFGVAHAASGSTGDPDSDGSVTAADAARTLRAAEGYESFNAQQSAAADATGNMEVGSPDAVAMLLFATGRIDSFSQLSIVTPDSLLGERHMDRFSYRGTLMKNDGYQSRDVSVTITRSTREDYVYLVADIYVQHLSSFQTAFAGGAYLGARELTQEIAQRNGAILAINGDGYSSQKVGPLVRNGTWYRNTVDRGSDLAVLYTNGELKTYAADSISVKTLEQSDVYQTWSGGPRLLGDDGAPLTSINSERLMDSHSARTAIGYYEPGHYCFVVVDGSQNPKSKGATLTQLADLLGSLGCKQAYMLYGGNSSVMTTQTKVLNTNPDGGRTVSDILYLCEPRADGETTR